MIMRLYSIASTSISLPALSTYDIVILFTSTIHFSMPLSAKPFDISR
jgi:hypothetical protein